ncbi:MAG: hypothetical protein KGL43_17080 [Burkholderiales bacterium]|nr:hypothetical protein [Burkholderiales bacterium]
MTRWYAPSLRRVALSPEKRSSARWVRRPDDGRAQVVEGRRLPLPMAVEYRSTESPGRQLVSTPAASS